MYNVRSENNSTGGGIIQQLRQAKNAAKQQ